jgi:hypothetical protein
MKLRTPAALLSAALALAACGDGPLPTDPHAPVAPGPAAPAAIVAADFCDGSTMPASECEALVYLYNTTAGPGWSKQDGWGVDPNPCTWEGVTCTDGASGSVEILDRVSTGLQGPLPAQLADLTELVELRLYINSLSGPIPPELGSLSKLEWFGVPYNFLTGSIPAELANLSSLRVLELEGNQLTGAIPSELGRLSNLESFLGSFNDMTGSIPPELGQLSSLRSLYLQGNQLSGQIPAELGTLASLDTLVLSGNGLTGEIPSELGNLSGLVNLYLHENQLTGPIPASFGQLTSLTRAGFVSNALSGPMPLGFAEIGDQLDACGGTPGNEDLFLPDTPEYRAADANADGVICGVAFADAGEIAEDAVDGLEELVPDPLVGGQANSLLTKIQNAVAKAEKGQYQAAINQLQAFLGQLADLVANGTMTAEQAAPFIGQAQGLITIWQAEL